MKINWNYVTVGIIAFTTGMAFEYVVAVKTAKQLDKIKDHK